jgi:hypothetical protein
MKSDRKQLINFPLPFSYRKIYKENLSQLNSSPFIVIAMFTPDNPYYERYADRLEASCEKYQLPNAIYEVPHVHNSISRNGSKDLAFTKANFICFNMQRFPEKNILYLDLDMFFADYPHAINEISRSQYEFAVYNWLNDQHNEAYVPLNMKIEAGNIYSYVYRFSHHIGYYCPDQLICSGGVQFYRNSAEAMSLLESWQSVIANSPDSADDECLDYAYNNRDMNLIQLKSFWLDKPYLRLPWWPHVKPVILHKSMPMAGNGRSPVPVRNDRQRFYPGKCRIRMEEFFFPANYLIDTKNGYLLMFENETLIDSRKITQEFWIYPEDDDSLERSE